jgi:two-component system phosphate regulon response regulator PhoB
MKKILIVDDEREVRRLVEVTLRSGNYEILKAENAEKAIELARSELPDLIIMDVTMPGDIDGFEATRVLKNDPETKAITIVMLTARGQEADKEKGLEVGANDYFVKPFSPLELIQKVEEMLG